MEENSNNTVRRNSPRAWMLASRPKTLSAAAVPVMIGAAMAWHMTEGVGFGVVPMILCFLFAFVMQIEANFINDYFDCVRGKDNEERLGPQRACQQGWISLPAMRQGMAITLLIAAAVGMPLVLYGGWQLIFIGAVCFVFSFLYTTLLASRGLGDVLVLLFFGIIPVVFTTFVCVPGYQQALAHMPWTEGLACGLVVDTLLLVNNYRDIDTDRHVGKRTLVVIIGRRPTEILYLLIIPLALLLNMIHLGVSAVSILLSLPVLALHLHTWREMKRIATGKALNKVLGMAARNIFVYGIMTTLIVILL